MKHEMKYFYPIVLRKFWRISVSLLLSGLPGLYCYAQNVDVQHVGKSLKDKLKDKKPFKISGGVSASTVFYAGNASGGRDPFSYLLNGNMNMSLYGVNVPVSFSLNNRGASYHYSYPRAPRRLSIHPKYKGITGHIGDVSMTLSPYTLNGVLFTGLGADISPKRSKFKYSILYGRLQKAVEYRPGNGNTLATYKRIGYGAKAGYDNGPYKLGLSVFKAKDILNSLVIKPDSLQIYPQENTAISLEGSVPIIKNLVAKIEYGISVLTKDLRAPKISDSIQINGLNKLLGGRISSSLYKAFKTELNYTIGSSMLGVGYERVDPGYQTLGTYYFTNDIENITAIFAQSLFKGKINLSGNVGQQRDDLDKRKSSVSSRNVAAVNISYTGSKRLTSTISYSNFQTYTNIKQQFQYINQLTPFDNLDTLNFRQLSQNTNLNINYVVSQNKEKPKNLNVNFSLQDSYDMQGGIIVKGNASRFYNLATAYNISNNPKAMNTAASFNITYNTIGGNNIITLGPTLGINKKLFGKKVNGGLSLSYNTTMIQSKNQNSIVAFRANTGYVFKKKHNLSMNAIGMLRKAAGSGNTHDYTATLTYNYNF